MITTRNHVRRLMVRLTKNIFYYKPMLFPRPGGFGSYIYIVKGNKGQLQIDTGAMGGGFDEKKAREMETDGLTVSETKALLITHAHPDHMRAIPFWVKRVGTDLPVWIHPTGVKYVHNQKNALHDLTNELGTFQKFVSRIPEGPGQVVTNWIWGDYSVYANACSLEDGQEFDLGNVTVKAIYTPGHDKTHCAYEVIERAESKGTGKRYLISGDIISFKDMGKGKGLIPLASINNPLSSYKDEIQSLKLIMADPPDVLCTGHYGFYDGKEAVKNYFQNAIAEAETLWNRTLTILRTEGPQKFKILTKKVINLKKYLAGIATRTSSMYVLLREMAEKKLVRKKEETPDIFELIE